MLDDTKRVIRIRISREDKKCLMILKGYSEFVYQWRIRSA